MPAAKALVATDSPGFSPAAAVPSAAASGSSARGLWIETTALRHIWRKKMGIDRVGGKPEIIASGIRKDGKETGV